MTIQHPLPQDDILPRGRGWAGIESVELDGNNWTLPFAAKYLQIPEGLLREAVKYTELAPAGTINMREYRSQGRTPRAYPAKTLIDIAETLLSLRD
jgi:hypothetical protein